ncbi:MAG: hypothetical protein JKY95_19895 [Planctomycetaceae bacterium]|nr:hypothetical protein [Planctomycetaceae bacterium]MBL4886775.1 hypothetical protein [Planctomycetaceae bacterium]
MSTRNVTLAGRFSSCYAVCFSILLLTATGCILGDGGTEFRGNVFDEDYKPIVGADVTMLSDPANKKRLLPSWTIQTIAEGKFRIRRGHAPVKGGIILEVEMVGYEPYSKRYEAGDIYANLFIVLKKKKPEVEDLTK